MNLFTKVLLLCLLTVLASQTLDDSKQNKSVSKRASSSQQWRDTKDTFNKVIGTINDQFIDENEIKNEEANATTTEGPYRITRSELLRILRRNVKGLQRVFKIELEEALSQPKDFEKNVARNTSTS